MAAPIFNEKMSDSTEEYGATMARHAADAIERITQLG
jgi:hypothetical protein